MQETLKVKPILAYVTSSRKEETSWRPWGGIQTESQAEEEAERIKRELSSLKPDFGLELLPLSMVRNAEDASEALEEQADVRLIYAATDNTQLMRLLTSGKPWNLIFIRHRSGPLYAYYEFVHPFLIRGWTDKPVKGGVGFEDVVVDDYDELLKKLRALNALKSVKGKKVVLVGGPSKLFHGEVAAARAKEIWDLELIHVPYEPDLADRIKKKRMDEDALKRAEKKAADYLARANVKSYLRNDFVVNSFLLYEVFEDLMEENDAEAIAINECMTTIIPLAKTTACLPLSMINDEGKVAVCEGDVVTLPAYLLLHAISQKPVFLNDPTFPHHGIVTIAHCTSPTTLNGKKPENVQLVTHYESDYGAAPKVLFERGQEVTVLDAAFEENTWVAFKAKTGGSTSYPTCRTQTDLEIEGDWKKLLNNMRGFHWVMAYGDYLDELEYALGKVGIELIRIR
ncbi:MAG: sugar isomerase [Thermoprotei archaeon]